MPVRLENLTGRPVLLVLSSGETLRLSPGELSASLADVEVASSRKIEKLVAGGVIAVHEQGGRPAREQARRSAPSRRGGKQGGPGTNRARKT